MNGRALFFIILSGATLSVQETVFAEVWRCGEPGTPLDRITNTPAEVGDEQCKPFPFHRGTFAKVHFPLLPTPSTHRSLLTPGPVRPGTERVQARVNWTVSDSADNRARRRKGPHPPRHCIIEGSAHAERKGAYEIRITRGALTVDEVQIHLSGPGSARRWKKKLIGQCRNPEVSIRRLS